MRIGDYMKFSINLKSAIIGIITGVINGLFGAGGGIIVVPSLIYIFKVDDHIAHATAIAIILPLALMSSVFYIYGNFVEWNIVIKTSIGGFVGGFVGANLLNKISSKYLRAIFGLFMIISSIRMVFFG